MGWTDASAWPRKAEAFFGIHSQILLILNRYFKRSTSINRWTVLLGDQP
jgi:hypothetical protein